MILQKSSEVISFCSPAMRFTISATFSSLALPPTALVAAFRSSTPIACYANFAVPVYISVVVELLEQRLYYLPLLELLGAGLYELFACKFLVVGELGEQGVYHRVL